MSCRKIDSPGGGYRIVCTRGGAAAPPAPEDGAPRVTIPELDAWLAEQVRKAAEAELARPRKARRRKA